MKKSIFSIFLSIIVLATHAQTETADSVFFYKNDDTRQTHLFTYKQILPVTLIGVGALRFKMEGMRRLDNSVRYEMQHIAKKQYHIDDYTQYSSIVAVYALNACGMKGRHNFFHRTCILATSSLITGFSVYTVKHTSRLERPASTTRDAFPSGHTATAFMGAEFLRQEYKDVSPVIGIVGYTVAGFTGVMRIYNDEHWLSDVIAGAGFGILSTRIAYWAYPAIQKTIFKNKVTQNSFAVPYYNGENAGISLYMTFN